MINIFIALLSAAVGIYLGSVIFGKDEPKVDTTEMQNPVTLYHPIVRTFEFRNGLTKEKLVADVLKPCMVEFYNHWYGSTEFLVDFYNHWYGSTEFLDEALKWPGNIEQLADRILEWYNPGSGYTELLLVAYSDGNGSFQVDFTWRKPNPMFICSRAAVEGIEQYYKDAN